MSTVQLTGAKGYDTQMVIHTGTRRYDVILSRKCQKYLSNVACKNGVIYQGKFKKGQYKKVERKRIYFQEDADVAHKDVNMSCKKNQFPSFPLCGPHTKKMVSEG